MAKLKIELVDLVSHQLRTPLSSVNWYSEMFLTGNVGAMSDKQKEYITQISALSHRMLRLVNNLLNISYIELGAVPMESRPISIVEFLNKIIDDLRLEIEKKNIVVIDSYSSVMLEIESDPQLLSAVFQNILSNAVKYTPPKGIVNVATSLDKDGNLLVTFSDTGYGIPTKNQGEIFNKMFRADNVKRMGIEGVGLGLYIVKSMLDRLGGKVWFESPARDLVETKEDVGPGTTFYVTLPIKVSRGNNYNKQ